MKAKKNIARALLFLLELSGNETRTLGWACDLESKLQGFYVRACSGEEEEEKQADSAPFISYDYFKTPPDQSGGAVAPNGRNTNTSVCIPRC